MQLNIEVSHSILGIKWVHIQDRNKCVTGFVFQVAGLKLIQGSLYKKSDLAGCSFTGRKPPGVLGFGEKPFSVNN